MLRKRLFTGFRVSAICLFFACEKEFDRELIFVQDLMIIVGGFEVSLVVGDFGDEVVSNKSLLFLSFIAIDGGMCFEVLIADFPMFWEGSFFCQCLTFNVYKSYSLSAISCI